ncbi:ABC transporter permease, partial [Paraburkholderia caribensis]|uniref:ABC transporter permease n=1 Tax=Paraburkholderia caribensis TaxID=75105 RepID=UPI00209037F9
RFAAPGWFTMQGMPFLLGRDFLPEEGIPGRDHEVILSYKLWNRLGGNRGILGQTLRVNNEAYTVVGVQMPGIGDRFIAELTVPL